VRKTISLDKIRPLGELSNATKRRKILGLSHRILDVVESEKENTFHITDNIKLKQVTFQTCNDVYNVNFGQFDKIEKTKRIEAVVKSLDKGHISRDAYRSLARVEQNIPREGDVYNVRQKINSEMRRNIPLTLVELSQLTISDPITDNDNTVITHILESVGKDGQ
jgi:hypothetical protein